MDFPNWLDLYRAQIGSLSVIFGAGRLVPHAYSMNPAEKMFSSEFLLCYCMYHSCFVCFMCMCVLDLIFIVRDCSDGDALPESATCSSTLFLPNYSRYGRGHTFRPWCVYSGKLLCVQVSLSADTLLFPVVLHVCCTWGMH